MTSAKKTYFIAISFFVFFAYAASACPTGQSVFGPKKYVRTTGAPNVYKDYFSAASGKGVLVIKNGDKNGKHRVTSALVFINGIQVLGPSDFKQAKYLMEIPVDLKNKNLILLELRSKPGTFLTIEIVKQQTDRPLVRITADPATVLAGKHATLTWTSTNADSCVIAPGIGSVGPSGSVSVSPGETTTYTITATGPGGSATDEATIAVITNHPPSVSIIRPHEEGEDPADCGFNIEWVDEDEDDNASISLYYDADNSGSDGVLIASGLAEDPDDDGDRHYWDTTDVAEGIYYVYAVIDDGVNDPVISYSSGPLEIFHDNADETKIFAGDAAQSDEFGKSVSVSGDYAIVGADGNDSGGSDSGAAYIFKRECNTWVEQAKLVSGDANAQDHFGRSVSISGDYAIVGACQDDESGTNSGAAYIFVRNGEEWIQQAKLITSDAGANDYFGYAVSISGDYAIVGAYQHNAGQGAAYIFKRDGDNWTEQAKLAAGVPDECRRFGWSVHINGGYAIAGAPGDSEDDIGSAYLFKREGDAWIEQARLAGNSSRFGHSVAVNENYAVVGAPRYEWEYDLSGEALVFKHEQSSWTKQADLSADEPIENQAGGIMERPLFGISVCLDGNRAAVGSYGVFAGTAYIYETEDDHWTCRHKLSDNMSNTYHGFSTAMSGRHAIVGAYRDDQANANAGAAYIYDMESVAKKPSITFVEPDGTDDSADCSFPIKWSDADADDNATISLYYDDDNSGEDGTLIIGGLKEDPDGEANIYVWDTTAVKKGVFYIYAVIEDGKSRQVTYAKYPIHIHSFYGTQKVTPDDPEINIGGRFASTSGGYAITDVIGSGGKGEVLVMKRTDNTWNESAILVAGDTVADNGFGCSGAINAEYIIVGASADDEKAKDAGAAYVFKHEGDTWARQAKLMANDGKPYDYFGRSVSIDGNYAIAGAMEDHDKGYNAGAAYIFKRIGNTWVQQAKLFANDGKSFNNFGSCVCINGDYAFAAAHGDNYAGAVYVFKRNGDIWTQQAKLTASDAQPSGYFGCSVSVSGDYAVIGSWMNAAYVLMREGSNWVESAKLMPGNASRCDRYVGSVSISGNHAVMGIRCMDAGGYFKYSACVFERNGDNWTNIAKLAPQDQQVYDSDTHVAIDGNSVLATAYGENQHSTYIYEIGPGRISVDPITVSMGEAALLSWSFPNASSVIIDNGIGEVSSEGSMAVTVNEPTIFTATAQGCWGTAVSRASLAIEEPTASIEADPATINLGGSSSLSWTTSNATSCVIEPGIGSVDASGSISVSPTEAATYTITATGPGGTTTAAATVSIAKPTVLLNAEPASIMAGNASTLTWSSANAVSCEIQPGIGTVDPSGSISVSPTQTTAYTITATGPGGTATANTTVTVRHPPTVSLSASPETIHMGESSVLTWNSSHADHAIIDHGIGSVALNGSTTISPAETTTYTITVSGPGGIATVSTTVNVIPLAVSITSPANGETLTGPDVMVRGSIDNPLGKKIKIKINGVPAFLHGDQFVANKMALEEGENIITARAVDAYGNSADQSITAYTMASGDYLSLSAYADSGVVPLETTLKLNGSFAVVGQPSITYTGPGEVEFLDSSIDGEYNVKMTTEGIYYFKAEASNKDNTVFKDEVAIIALNASEQDALIKATWNEMKAKLISGDIEGALDHFSPFSREIYGEIFAVLGGDIAGMATEMEDIELIYIKESIAKYRIKKNEAINGGNQQITYYIYFVRDVYGDWHIDGF
jgi:hypothetical protein